MCVGVECFRGRVGLSVCVCLKIRVLLHAYGEFGDVADEPVAGLALLGPVVRRLHLLNTTHGTTHSVPHTLNGMVHVPLCVRVSCVCVTYRDGCDFVLDE